MDERTVQLQHLARYDGLTDLANHRTFYEIFQKEWAVAGREKKAVVADRRGHRFLQTLQRHPRPPGGRRMPAQGGHGHPRPGQAPGRPGGAHGRRGVLPPAAGDGHGTGRCAMAEAIRAGDRRPGHPPSRFADRRRWSRSASGVSTTIPPPATEANQFIARADQALYARQAPGTQPHPERQRRLSAAAGRPPRVGKEAGLGAAVSAADRIPDRRGWGKSGCRKPAVADIRPRRHRPCLGYSFFSRPRARK